MENLYEKNCIRTFTGIYFNVLEPKPEMVSILDIAHSLSHQCRFAGHLPYLYSVAQHSIAVCNRVKIYKLEALLHDASEAYLLDMPKPVKELLPDYRALEERICKVIAEGFNLVYPWPDEVIEADKDELEDEWHILMIKRLNITFNPNEIVQSFLYLFELYQK